MGDSKVIKTGRGWGGVCGTLLEPEAAARVAKREFVRWKKLPATDFHPESAAAKNCSLCIRRQHRLGGSLLLGNGNGNGICNSNFEGIRPFIFVAYHPLANGHFGYL